MASFASGFPLREVGLVAVAALAAYLLLAMGSYSPDDPAWTFAGSDLLAENLVGRSGAFTADLVLLSLGWSAYLLPVCLLAASAWLLRRDALAGFSWQLAALRVCGVVVAVVSLCVLLRLHVAPGGRLPAGAGGVVGAGLVSLGLPMLNPVGLTLCALVLFAIGLQAALGYSWLVVAEHSGRALHWAWAWALAGVRFALGALRRLAERARELARQRAEAVQEPAVAEPELMPAPALPPPLLRPPVAGRVEPVLQPATPPAVEAEFEDALDDAPAPQVARAAAAAQSLPDLELLEPFEASSGYSEESLREMSRLLEVKLADFGIEAQVVSVMPGPVVTRFELRLAAGVKAGRITSLAKDLARSLAVVSVRILEIVPGKSVVGIEVPNESRETVRLKEVLDSDAYRGADSPLTLALGKDIAGAPVMADIGKMPHLLVAGTTGSGKSVGINAMLLSMLYKATPDQLRLILVDPKMLELATYDGIPHLLTPVVTDMKDAAQALNWCVAEMERRYRLMAAIGVRNIAGCNRRIAEAPPHAPVLDPLCTEPEAPPLEPLPYIVVVIDEFADMMMIVGKKVEQLIARIAQKARAAGISLVLATQRPSVDVITGLIKANIPARIGFQVSSKVDSRTILDQGGAEQLLGHGDMLFLQPGTSTPVRVHGAFVSDEEVAAVANAWKREGEPDYITDLLEGAAPDVPGTVPLGGDAETDEPLYDEAVAFVLESRRASISSVQRKLRVGYNRAARLIEAMENAGVVSAMDSNGARQVLVPERAEL